MAALKGPRRKQLRGKETHEARGAGGGYSLPRTSRRFQERAPPPPGAPLALLGASPPPAAGILLLRNNRVAARVVQPAAAV